PGSFGVGANPTTTIAVGDFNGDGKQDLAVPNFGSSNVSILLGDGAGGFGSATNFSVGLSSFGGVVGDFDGDGKQDLAAANWDSNNVSILLRQCCSFSISPSSKNFGASGGSDSVAVTAGANCDWTAVSNDAFIQVTSGASGSGGGLVNYSVSANV